MKNMIKRLIGWNHKTERERDDLRHRFCLWRYHLMSAISYVVCILPIPLRFVLRATRSDKHTPSNLGGHVYGYTYGNIFWKLKYRPIKILEIGIGGYDRWLGGESLIAWQAYFPFAKIVACDIQPKQSLNTFRTKIYKFDQSLQQDINMLCAQETSFDIIIDDGSHLSQHQIFTFENLYHYVKEGGVYVIEDIQTSYWSFDEWDGANVNDPGFEKTCVGYFLNLAKYLNYNEFTDIERVDKKALELAKSIKQIIFEHNLIIVIRGANLQPSNSIRRWGNASVFRVR
jgi:hypothetical protein